MYNKTKKTTMQEHENKLGKRNKKLNPHHAPPAKRESIPRRSSNFALAASGGGQISLSCRFCSGPGTVCDIFSFPIYVSFSFSLSFF